MEEIARVYSRSLFEVAVEHKRLDVITEQLGQLSDALADSHDLAVFFFSPYFSTEEKTDGLSKLIEGGDQLLLNFLELLIEKHRMPAIHRIRKQVEALYQEHNKQLPVQVTSAIELDEATIAEIGKRIGERTGREVKLTTLVEPDILGGIVLRVGNSILDASIRSRLEQLRKQVARG